MAWGRDLIIGFPKLHECQACQGLFLANSLISGNTRGSRVWTDGAIHSPMLRHRPMDMAVCPHCGVLMRVREQHWIKGLPGTYGFNEADYSPEELDILAMDEEDPVSDIELIPLRRELTGVQVEQIPRFKSLNFQNWLEASDGPWVKTSKDRLAFRLQAWRCGNDERRYFGSSAMMRKREVVKAQRVIPEDELENIDWLIQSLDEGPVAGIYKVELYRHIGDFRRASKLLLNHFPDEFVPLRAYMNGLVDARDLRVQCLPHFLNYPKTEI